MQEIVGLLIISGVFLVMTIAVKLLRQKKIKKNQETLPRSSFVLYHSNSPIAIFVLCTLFCFGGVISMIIFSNETTSWVNIVVMGMVGLISLCLWVGFIKWRLVVTKEVITLTTWLKGTQSFKVEHIKTVKQTTDGLIIYFEDGVRIDVSNVNHLDQLSRFLQEEGKFDYLQQEKFNQVQRTRLDEQEYKFEMKYNKFLPIFYFFCAIGLMSIFIFSQNNPTVGILVPASIFLVYAACHHLYWKATVDVCNITVKNIFRKTRIYAIKEITSVNIKTNGDAFRILLYKDNKCIVKISSFVSRTDWLLERLTNEKVTFYRNGKPS